VRARGARDESYSAHHQGKDRLTVAVPVMPFLAAEIVLLESGIGPAVTNPREESALLTVAAPVFEEAQTTCDVIRSTEPLENVPSA
jgi:hypothetical protein